MDIFLPFEENSLHFIDDIVKSWGRVVVPFFANNPKSTTGANGFGSGFLIRFEGSHYLVSALHVIEEALKHDAVVLNINGKGVVLEHITFFKDELNDLVITPIDDFLAKNGFTSISAVELNNDKKLFEPLGYYLLMGYPGTKNKLDTRWNKVDRTIYSLTAEISQSINELKTEIAKPLIFDFDPKDQVNSSLEPTGKPPQLYGMSGGPAFEIHAKRITDDEIRFDVRLAGVLVEWHQNKKAVVATSKDALNELLQRANKALHRTSR